MVCLPQSWVVYDCFTNINGDMGIDIANNMGMYGLDVLLLLLLLIIIIILVIIIVFVDVFFLLFFLLLLLLQIILYRR